MILKGSPNFEKKQELKKERTEKKNRGRTYQEIIQESFPNHKVINLQIKRTHGMTQNIKFKKTYIRECNHEILRH